MEPIQIAQQEVVDKKKALAVLVHDANDLQADLPLTKQEISYIRKKLEQDVEMVFLHKPEEPVVVQKVKRHENPSKQVEAARLAGHDLHEALNSQKVTAIQLLVAPHHDHELLGYAEGVALANYQYLKFKSGKGKNGEARENTLKAVTIIGKVEEPDLQAVNVSVQANFVARDLVNEPVITLTAVELGERIKQLGKEAGFKAEVLNKNKIESLKMGGLLAVNCGSQDPPTFSIMEYKPKGAVNKQPVVLVGKGVVYDTGGLSLKGSQYMMDMKSDMGGAAAVIGTMYAVAKAKLPVHVVGLVPATDNRPGEKAITPGDVITMFDGQTVEVLNTDAEGRLILADALAYAKRYKPEMVIDLATLTGAAARAIGKYGIVMMGTAEQGPKDKLQESGWRVYERLVEFPVWEEYDELLKSDIADMKNIGGPEGGAITAGKFLQRFIDYPWMHFDIAGTAFLESKDSYRGKGATGSGVRVLFDWLRRKGEA